MSERMTRYWYCEVCYTPLVPGAYDPLARGLPLFCPRCAGVTPQARVSDGDWLTMGEEQRRQLERLCARAGVDLPILLPGAGSGGQSGAEEEAPLADDDPDLIYTPVLDPPPWAAPSPSDLAQPGGSGPGPANVGYPGPATCGPTALGSADWANRANHDPTKDPSSDNSPVKVDLQVHGVPLAQLVAKGLLAAQPTRGAPIRTDDLHYLPEDVPSAFQPWRGKSARWENGRALAERISVTEIFHNRSIISIICALWEQTLMERGIRLIVYPPFGEQVLEGYLANRRSLARVLDDLTGLARGLWYLEPGDMLVVKRRHPRWWAKPW